MIETWRNNGKINFQLAWILFIPLMVYVILRAIYVPPLHDEVATFFHYIETGDIWSETTMLDANNHLLNSYLSRVTYLIFGEEFWSLRLPNILSFIIYFWSTVALVQHLKSSLRGWITLLALNTIPFVIEYYAMTRGYGLGIAFLMASISLVVKWQQQAKLTLLLAGMTMAWLSVFSNLIFINTFVLLAFFIALKLLIKKKDLGLKKTFINLTVIIFSVVALLPLFSFGLRMKMAGALYYGSLDGLWEVTGKSLSNYTLFTEHILIKWLLIILLFGFVVWSMRTLILNKLKKSVDSAPLLMNYLFLGNLVITLILALFFEVNYPEDRAGIHFVILFVLAFSFTLDDLSLPIVSLILMFFPISFIYKLNLSHTVVTPDQTLPKSFYYEIRAQIDHKEAVEIYPTQALIWAYYERSQEEKLLVKMGREVDPAMQAILTREPFFKPKVDTGFSVLNFDPITRDYLLKNSRKSLMFRRIDLNPEKKFDKGRQEVASHKVDYKKVLLVHYEGAVKGVNKNDITIEIDGLDTNGNRVYFSYYPLRWYFGVNTKEYLFKLNQGINLAQHDLKEIKVYIFNRSGQKIKVEDSNLYLEYISYQ